MVRELPKIDFNGTLFYIDLRLDEFRQVDNPYNRIDFDELYETPHGFKMHFDPVTKSAFRGSEGEFMSRDDIELVKLATLEEMDPVGFKMMVERWKEDNPLLTAMIESLPLVLNNGEKTTIGNHLQEHNEKRNKPLLEKKRHSNKKGLRP